MENVILTMDAAGRRGLQPAQYRFLFHGKHRDDSSIVSGFGH
jgi:hypothetical protein